MIACLATFFLNLQYETALLLMDSVLKEIVVPG